MRIDELRRIAESAIAGKDRDNLATQAGQGIGLAVTIVKLLDERAILVGQRDGVLDEVDRLRADNDRLRAELRRMEWSNYLRSCPACGAYADGEGHAPDCTLAAALGG